MDKELLITMYERKDPKRRRKLYEFFQELFAQNLSALLTVEIINKELGSELTVLYDVKYIRSHAAKWNDPGKTGKTSSDTIPKPVEPNTVWIEEDALKRQSFKSSKFGKS
ncbi:hypothetical protein ACFP1I_22265 [Dyadobacter subterraneus]|uniref:Uncharacterized protein n=1 Tax=Dyadobacter subterraneus TaxID=2773304 RepID=A0ABR9WJ11_9BACT|nr:hypothetical protein [Dyadobacter subterraneus]MBE9465509.1 hypothetical protein [Dyadobacter subterraneus]